MLSLGKIVPQAAVRKYSRCRPCFRRPGSGIKNNNSRMLEDGSHTHHVPNVFSESYVASAREEMDENSFFQPVSNLDHCVPKSTVRRGSATKSVISLHWWGMQCHKSPRSPKAH